MTITALINPSMLTWARDRSGVALAEFATKCGVTEDQLCEWESGQRKISFVKAQQFAKKANIPFGYLFLKLPPVDDLPIPDLRTINDRSMNHPSAELLDLVKLTIQQQTWYRDYLVSELADPCDVVGISSLSNGVDAVVANMRSRLHIGLFPERGDSDDYYRDLIGRIEALGIMVMRQSYFGNTTRPFRVEEFRGFAIADKYAPIIFVNHSDAPGPRLFTLIHELCHIWLGVTGISDADEQSHLDVERFCNAVAAEFLVPKIEFSKLWVDEVNWEKQIAVIADQFRVSKWVVARRAMTLGVISYALYQRYISKQIADWKQRDKSRSGPSYYVVKNSQVSVQFSKAVLSEAFNGHLQIREAGQLLNIKPANIRKFAEQVGV